MLFFIYCFFTLFALGSFFPSKNNALPGTHANVSLEFEELQIFEIIISVVIVA